MITDDISLWDFEDSENILFHTKDEESNSLKDLKLDYTKNINLFVWPEWGFSDEEINVFVESWFKKVHLWNRILRTETTWVVAWFYIIQNR
jgi:RsmE family RNA methyltransferase